MITMELVTAIMSLIAFVLFVSAPYIIRNEFKFRAELSEMKRKKIAMDKYLKDHGIQY